MALDIATLALEVKSAGVVEASNALRKMQDQARQTEAAADSLNSTATALQGTFGKLAGLAAGALAGFSMVNYIKEATLAAARYETMGIVIEQAGKNAHYASYEMAGFQTALQKSGIAMQESRQVLTSLTTAQIDLAQASKLSRAAQDLAVVGGINSSEAFSRLTYGITTAQVEVLRTIGLNVSFEESYKKLAQELGKTTAALTTQEKTQARVNAALEGAAGYMGIYEASMETAGKQLGSLPRYFQDIQVMVGEVGLDAFSIGIQEVTKYAKGASAELTELKESGELREWGQSIGDVFKSVVDNIDNVIIAIGAYQVASRAMVAGAAVKNTIGTYFEDAKTHGVIGALGGEASASSKQVTASLNEQIIAQRALYKAEIDRLESQRLQQEMDVRRAQNAYASAVGTKNETLEMIRLESEQRNLGRTTENLARAHQTLTSMTLETTKSTSALSRASAGLRSMGTGLIDALGGPWVAGLTAVAVAAYGVYESFTATNEQIEQTTKFIDDLKNRLDKEVDIPVNYSQEAYEAEAALITKQIGVLKNEINDLRTNYSFSWTQFFGVNPNDVAQQVKAIMTPVEGLEQLRLKADEASIVLNRLKSQRLDAGFLDVPGIGNAVEMLEAYLKKTEERIKLEEKLVAMGSDSSTATALRDEAKAAEASKQAFEKLNMTLQNRASAGLITDLESATAYTTSLYDKSQAAADAQRALAGSAELAAQQILQQSLAAAYAAKDLEAIANVWELITQLNAAVTSGPASKTRTSSVSSALQAQKALESLRIEIAQMEGVDTTYLELDQKLAQVGETAKKAGQSAEEFKRRYTNAFEAQRAREFNKELQEIELSLLELEGKTRQANALKLDIDTAELEQNLIRLGVPTDEIARKLARLRSASATSLQVQDLQGTVSFMQQLSSLSGEYGETTRLSNELIQTQANLYRQELPESLHGYIAEWERLSLLQNDTSWVGGIQRGLLEVKRSATDAATVMQNVITSAANQMSTSLATFVLEGKGNFSDLARSILNDMAQIAIKAASSQIISSIFGFAANAIGSFFGGSSLDKSIGNMASGSSNAFAAGIASVAHTGGIIGQTPLETRAVPMSLFVGAERYHGGGVIGAGEVPIIAKREEGIFTPEQMRHLAPVGGGVPQTVVMEPKITIIHDKDSEVSTEVKQDNEGNMNALVYVSRGVTARQTTSGTFEKQMFSNSFGIRERAQGR